jgi:hypothetical protein
MASLTMMISEEIIELFQVKRPASAGKQLIPRQKRKRINNWADILKNA